MYKIFLPVLLIIIFTASCVNQDKTSPDLGINRIIKEISFGNNFADVKEMLEKDYLLEYKGEYEGSADTNNVYHFTGGTLHGSDVEEWRTAFTNDSLYFLMIIFEPESPEKRSNFLSKLGNEINELPYEIFKKNDDEWIISQGGEELCGIKLDVMNDVIILLLSSPKFIGEYSYL